MNNSKEIEKLYLPIVYTFIGDMLAEEGLIISEHKIEDIPYYRCPITNSYIYKFTDLIKIKNIPSKAVKSFLEDLFD